MDDSLFIKHLKRFSEPFSILLISDCAIPVNSESCFCVMLLLFLAPEQTIDGFFRGESIPVNKKLSEIFLQLHISEKTGRGVPKITSTYGKDVYEFHKNSIVVKIPFKWINKVGDKPGDKTGDISELNATQIKVLSEIRNNPNITKPELEKLVGVGKTTIDNAISVLKKINIIERIGSNKTGYWQVKR